jgi:hypothetical protein
MGKLFIASQSIVSHTFPHLFYYYGLLIKN